MKQMTTTQSTLNTVSTLYELLDLQDTGSYENGTLKLKRPSNITNNLESVKFRSFAANVKNEIENITRPEMNCELTARVLHMPSNDDTLIDNVAPGQSKSAALTISTRDIQQSQTFARQDNTLLSLGNFTIPMANSVADSITSAYSVANEELRNRLGIISEQDTNPELRDASAYNYNSEVIEPFDSVDAGVESNIAKQTEAQYISMNNYYPGMYKDSASPATGSNLNVAYYWKVVKNTIENVRFSIVGIRSLNSVTPPTLPAFEKHESQQYDATTATLGRCVAYTINPVTNTLVALYRNSVEQLYVKTFQPYQLNKNDCAFIDNLPIVSCTYQNGSGYTTMMDITDVDNYPQYKVMNRAFPYSDTYVAASALSPHVYIKIQLLAFRDGFAISHQYINAEPAKNESIEQPGRHQYMFGLFSYGCTAINTPGTYQYDTNGYNIIGYNPRQSIRDNNAINMLIERRDARTGGTDWDDNKGYKHKVSVSRGWVSMNQVKIVYVGTIYGYDNEYADEFFINNNHFNSLKYIRKMLAFNDKACMTIALSTVRCFTCWEGDTITSSSFSSDVRGYIASDFKNQKYGAYDFIPDGTYTLNVRCYHNSRAYVSYSHTANVSDISEQIVTFISSVIRGKIPVTATDVTQSLNYLAGDYLSTTIDSSFFKGLNCEIHPHISINTAQSSVVYRNLSLVGIYKHVSAEENLYQSFLVDFNQDIKMFANGYVSTAAIAYTEGKDPATGKIYGSNVGDKSKYIFINNAMHRTPWYDESTSTTKQPGYRLTHPPDYAENMFRCMYDEQGHVVSVNIPCVVLTSGGDSSAPGDSVLLILGLRIDTFPHYFTIDSQNISFPNHRNELPNITSQLAGSNCSLSTINVPLKHMTRIYNQRVFDNLDLFLATQSNDTALRLLCTDFQSNNQIVFHLNESAMVDFKTMTTSPQLPYITCKIVDANGNILSLDAARALYSNLTVSLDWSYLI